MVPLPLVPFSKTDILSLLIIPTHVDLSTNFHYSFRIRISQCCANTSRQNINIICILMMSCNNVLHNMFTIIARVVEACTAYNHVNISANNCEMQHQNLRQTHCTLNKSTAIHLSPFCVVISVMKYLSSLQA